MTVRGHKLPLPEGASGSPSRPLAYGIRPEHLEINAAGVPAVVSVIEPTGSETQILAELGDQQVLAVVRDRHVLHPGDEIRLLPNAESAHLFDGENGERI